MRSTGIEPVFSPILSLWNTPLWNTPLWKGDILPLNYERF